jgi:hypothetical protein
MSNVSSSDLIDSKLEEHQLCGSKHCPRCGHKFDQGKPVRTIKFSPLLSDTIAIAITLQTFFLTELRCKTLKLYMVTYSILIKWCVNSFSYLGSKLKLVFIFFLLISFNYILPLSLIFSLLISLPLINCFFFLIWISMELIGLARSTSRSEIWSNRSRTHWTSWS